MPSPQERRVASALTTPLRAAVPLRRASQDEHASYIAHNLTLPSGLSPITGGCSPATAFDESDPDAFLTVAAHGSPSPRPTGGDDAYYRPHLRRPPAMPTQADDDFEEDDADAEEEQHRGAPPSAASSQSSQTGPSRPRLSQALRGSPQSQSGPRAAPRRNEWRASLPATTASASVPSERPRPAQPFRKNTGLNISPSPARGASAGTVRPERTAPPTPRPPSQPQQDSVEAFKRMQQAAQEAQDDCTLRRAVALEEENGLRQVLAEEARLTAEVTRLEAYLQSVPSGVDVAYVYDDLEAPLKAVAGPLDIPGANARAQQRWSATHVPWPGTLSPLSKHETQQLYTQPASAASDHAKLEREIDHRYRLSKLVAALDEERQKTKFLRARHGHLVEAYKQRTQRAVAASQGRRPSRSEDGQADDDDDADDTDEHDNEKDADSTGEATHPTRLSLFCGAAGSPRRRSSVRFPTSAGSPVPERIQAEVAEDLEQTRHNLSAIHALAVQRPTASLASALPTPEPESLEAPVEAPEVEEEDAASASWRAALAENAALRRQFSELVRAGEEEAAGLLEYYQLLLARLVQRTETLCKEWRTTSEPAHVLSEDENDSAKQRSRIVSWF